MNSNVHVDSSNSKAGQEVQICENIYGVSNAVLEI